MELRQICEEGRGHCIPVPLLLGADRYPLLVTVHFKQITVLPEYVALQRGAVILREHLNSPARAVMVLLPIRNPGTEPRPHRRHLWRVTLEAATSAQEAL